MARQALGKTARGRPVRPDFPTPPGVIPANAGNSVFRFPKQTRGSRVRGNDTEFGEITVGRPALAGPPHFVVPRPPTVDVAPARPRKTMIARAT